MDTFKTWEEGVLYGAAMMLIVVGYVACTIYMIVISGVLKA